MIKWLLFPGRHHAVTTFQAEYLTQLQSTYPESTVVWAVTSADHANTRRNPFSGSRRLGMIESVVTATNMRSQVYLIGNKRENPHFAHYVIEDIRVQSSAICDMTHENTVVVCSTPIVIDMYTSLGFHVETAELGSPEAVRPWNVVEAVIAAGSDWKNDNVVRQHLHPTAMQYYDRYNLADHVRAIFSDPLIDSSDGDITISRDYETYRASFERGAYRKIDAFSAAVRPGRIMDVGCATGQTLKLLGEMPELFESDFYGIEAARPLYDICEQRKTNGEFGDTNVYFYRRNIMQSELFPDDSLSTIITMALTHEIESYLGRSELERFLRRAFDMLEPEGVYINYDVVGPDHKDQEVYVLFNDADGENPDDLKFDLEEKALSEFLGGLSTAARFKRFAVDFRSDEGERIQYRTEQQGGVSYTVLRFADLCEFLAKKDYIDSWKSEMHEKFCFFSHDDWCRELAKVGFEIDDQSKAIQNPWLIENRFAPAAQVFVMHDGKLLPYEQPVTNTLLVARKPLA